MDLPHRFSESLKSKSPENNLKPNNMVQCDDYWFGRNPGAGDLLETPADVESQELMTGTRMEVAHMPKPRPNQNAGCGHSESSSVEPPVCAAENITKVFGLSSCTEFFFSSSRS